MRQEYADDVADTGYGDSGKLYGGDLQSNGEYVAECVEGVDYFKYWGRVLHFSDEEWPEVFQNWSAIKICKWLGKFLRREGADLTISAKFYRTLVKAVLLFGTETWVLTLAMLKKIEGINVSFLWQVMGMKAQRLGHKN